MLPFRRRLRAARLALACAAALALLAWPAGPARAQGGIDGLARIEVLDGGPTGRGTHQAALRLTLAEGWKTYWRHPGEAGIPPSFSWRGSRNLGAVRISWPTPIVFSSGGLRSIGYKDELVLPLEITPSRPGAPVELRGVMDLGICADICVPERLRFARRLDPEAPRHPAIAAALAQRPYGAAEAGVRAARCRISPVEGGMRVEARITMPPAGGAEMAVIEPADPGLWTMASKTRRQGDVIVAVTDLASADGGAFALDRSRLRITVLGQRHAVEIRGCAAAG